MCNEKELHASLLACCEQYLNICKNYASIEGMSKLVKSCQSEKRFLEKKSHYSLSELKSTNLVNIQGVLLCALFLRNVSAILKTFKCSFNSKHGTTVDVVFDNGLSWAKVITKKSKTLNFLLNEECQYGQKSIEVQAQDYVNLAQLYPHNFKTPKLFYIFFHEISDKLKAVFNKMGIHIIMSTDLIPEQFLKSTISSNIFLYNDNYVFETSRFFDEEMEKNCALNTNFPQKTFETSSPESNNTSSLSHYLCDNTLCKCKSVLKDVKCINDDYDITAANLDITTMLAMCSNLCHGGCDFNFSQNHLALQAHDEKDNPQLPMIFQKIIGKNLYTCETAASAFKSIIDVVGGKNEKQRADKLLSFIKIIPDQQSKRISTISSSRLNDRAKRIFGTGDFIKAITLTANQGFVRAIQQTGVQLVVFVHQPRSLSEQKETCI